MQDQAPVRSSKGGGGLDPKAHAWPGGRGQALISYFRELGKELIGQGVQHAKG